MSDKTLFILMSLLLLFLFYSKISFVGFQVRNPTANDSTFYTHFSDVMMWKKLDKFQTE